MDRVVIGKRIRHQREIFQLTREQFAEKILNEIPYFDIRNQTKSCGIIWEKGGWMCEEFYPKSSYNRINNRSSAG